MTMDYKLTHPMDKIKYAKSESVAFTGHRSIPVSHIASVKTSLRNSIKNLYDEGMTNFISGMAVGFDMLSAETVISLKGELPDITLTAVVPFRGQADRWNSRNRQRYERILQEADQVVILSDCFFKGCEMKRNEYMIDNASRLIAYFNGEPHGGTYFTYNRAETLRLPIINLYN